MISAQIFSIDYYLPEYILGNEVLADLYSGWSAEKISKKLGIDFRRIAADNETALDMAVKASQMLFDRKVCVPDEIDFVILCTQSPDYFLPTSACLLQSRLGIPKTAGALDFNLGCSGYVYGLSLCKGLIETGVAKNILFVTSETYSKYINPADRVNRPLFGDGAAVTLIRGVEIFEEHEKNQSPFIGPFVLGTNGDNAQMLIVPAGGHRLPCNETTNIEECDSYGNYRSQEQLYMNGQGIFAFAIREIPPLIEQLLKKASKTRDDINCYVFHQANKYMLECLQELAGLENHNFFNDIRNIGNTVSSSIPIAMVDAAEQGTLNAGDTVMLVGFGVGLSWGATLVRLPKSLVRKREAHQQVLENQ